MVALFDDNLSGNLLSRLQPPWAFIPHGHCYLWQPELVGLHVLADGLIAVAYFSIPIALLYFVSQRRDLPYPWIFYLFGAFIISCGLTHVMEIWTLWHPIYWVSGLLKAITALISVATALSLIPLIPEALTLPSRSELAAAKAELEQQVRERTESLRLSEERWQLALRGNHDGIWDWNVRTNTVFFSSRWKEMLGFTDAEIGNHLDEWAKRVHPDDLEQVTDLIQAHFDGKTPFYISEHRMQCKDGSYRWILDRGQALWDETGQVVRMVGSHTDITEHKQIEQDIARSINALQESEAKYRNLINHLNAGFVVHGPDTQILQCNIAACDLLGLSMDQILGKTAIDPSWHFIQEDGTIMSAAEYPVNRVLRTQETLNKYVLGIDRGTQPLVWVLVTAFPEFNADHQLQQIVVTFIDITELKTAEAELRELTRVMENVVSGCSKLDAQGRYLYVNKAYAEITGYAPEEMLGLSWQETVHPQDIDLLTKAYQQMMCEGKVELEARGIRKQGTEFYKQLVMISDYDQDGQFMGHYCFMKDISDRKQAEFALERELLRSTTLFNTSIDGIVVLDGQGNVAQTSPSFAQMLGYSIEETLMLNVVDWDAQWTREELQAILTADILPPRFETRHRRKDNSIYDVEISYNLEEIRGEKLHFCICRDITERKQAEIALQNSQARFAGILEIASDAIISIDCNHQITLFNKGAESIFGYQAEEVLGKPLNLLLPERFIQSHSPQINEYARQLENARQMAHRGAIFGRRKDGKEFPAEASISKLNLNGEIIFTTFLRDVTERRQAELALRESEDKFRMAIDFTYNWEYWQAPDQSFVYISPSCERVTGYTPQEFIDNPQLLYNIVHPSDRQIFASHSCNQNSMTNGLEFRIFTRTGETRWIAHVCQPVFNQAGNYLGRRATNRDITERKHLEAEHQQAENALRESEARFQAFMNHSPAAAWITDAQGVILYLSQSYLRTFQLSDSDWQGKSIFDVYPLDIAQQFLTNIQTVAQTGQIVETVEIAPRADGTMGDFSVYKFPIPDMYGEILVGGVAIDITMQRQAEQEVARSLESLRESEATKQAIIQAIPDLLIRMQADGSHVDFISDTRFNVVKPHLIQRNANVYNNLPPDLAAIRVNYAQKALACNAMQIYEQEIFIEGKKSYEEVRVVPLLEHEVLVMVRDISDRKQAELELRHQKEMLQAIVNHIPVMIALFNDQGKIEFINPELEQVLGWSLTDWQTQDILSLSYPDPHYRQMVLDHMLIATGNWQDLTTLTATGQVLDTSWANVRLSNGRFLGIGQDISDRKHKETALRIAMEAAESANVAKSMFLANMSHELRTPLNVILGFAQVMDHDPSLTPSQHEDLQTIRRSGDHLLSLINDILDLSKIESGHCVIESASFDLIAVLHSLRTMLAERAKSKGIRLQFDIAPEVPQFISADAQKLRQILLNLLSNAIKFTKEGGVTLRVTLNGNYPAKVRETNSPISHPPVSLLQFEVTDTGIGIADEEINTIFDAFVQAEAGRKASSGTGLGLTISHKLIELMGGEIFVKSQLGQGSTFVFTLPTYASSGVDIQLDQSDRLVIGLLPNQPHRRILIVDDQQENRSLIVRLLAQLGLEVKEAANGLDAVQIWQDWQPDLIWMDIRMPELDGYEATRQIRAREHQQTTVIIALTAQASQSDRTLAIAAGCDDYISKPFREETLFLKLSEYLGLQYIYADSNPDTTTPADLNLSTDQSSDHSKPSVLLTPNLTQLSPTWLNELELAAVCGNDGTVMQLLEQLPSESTQFKTHIKELASQYQFERIIQIVQQLGSAPNTSQT